MKDKKFLIFWSYAVFQLIAVTIVGIVFEDGVQKIATALLGVGYAVFMAKGMRLAFVFGWGHLVLYTITCLQQKLYAMAGYMVFLFAVMISSFISWKKNSENNSVIPRLLSNKIRLILISLTPVSVVGLSAILYVLNGSQPIPDAAFFILSTVSSILVLLRYGETWLFLVAANIVSCVIWTTAIFSGSPNYSLLLYGAFCIITCSTALISWTKKARLASADCERDEKNNDSQFR